MKVFVSTALLACLVAGSITSFAAAPLTLPEVTPVEKRPEHEQASQRIDQILEAYWARKGVRPSSIAEDSVFLRRSYLNIIGRIPTNAEAEVFLEDESPNKRTELVDHLLDSQGYVSHQFNWWADLLRARSTGREGGQYGGLYYVPWIKEQVRQNVPYDAMVHQLLTADGYPWENPAVGYYMRDFGMPLDNMSMTAQVFLGTQMQCAQCHDHPTDQWTQKDFYEIAAFTYGLRTGANFTDKETPLTREVFNELRKLIPEELAMQGEGKKKKRNYNNIYERTAREFMIPMRMNVVHTGRQLKLPHDYQYEDAKPKSTVEPEVLFGELPQADLHDSPDRVESYVEWLIDQNNERFTLTIANRLWKQAMGKGLIDPVDNLTDESVAEIPELMDYLQTVMVAVNYDLKQFQRVLYQTNFYQRRSVADNPDLPNDYHWEGPLFRRMSAEQIWDSMATLLTPDIDYIFQQSYDGNYRGAKLNSQQEPPVASLIDKTPPEEVAQHIFKIAEVYQIYQDTRSVWNSYRSDPEKRKSPDYKDITKKFKDAEREWRAELNKGYDDAPEDTPMMGMAMMQMAPEQAEVVGKDKNAQRFLKGIRRASELPSPAPSGHLLEVFGQSDRLLIENSDTSGNVLQALFLMNSNQTNRILAQRSMPAVQAAQKESAQAQLDTLYMGFLTRAPSAAETEILLPQLEADSEKARERIIWAMLNTQQFLFIQ